MDKCKECVYYKHGCEFSQSDPSKGEFVACVDFIKNNELETDDAFVENMLADYAEQQHEYMDMQAMYETGQLES